MSRFQMFQPRRVRIISGWKLCAWLVGACLLGGTACRIGGIGVQNQPPVAQDQSVTVVFQSATVITLAANDPDGGPSALTFSIVTPPTRGTLSELTGNTVTYTPDADTVGSDSFTFTAADSAATSNTASVSIDVTSPGAGTIVADATIESLTIEAGDAATVLNSAQITVTGDAAIDGTLTAMDGRLTLRVHGSLTVNGSLIAANPTADVPGDEPLDRQSAGILIVVGDAAVTFGPDAEVRTDGPIVITDDESVLESTPDDLYNEVEDVSGDDLPTLVPLPPDDPVFNVSSAPKRIAGEARVAVAQAMPPVTIAGTWPTAGVPAPAGDQPIVIFRFIGPRPLNLDNWTVNGPPAPAGTGGSQSDNPGNNASGGSGKKGMNLNIRNDGGPINVTGDVVLNLADGGDGGVAEAVCASATGGNGAQAGNFRMTAADGIDLSGGTLTINPGRSGSGGEATVSAGAAAAGGCPGGTGDSATATGGNGADNLKRLYVRGSVEGLENLTIGDLTAGDGGDATATACDGGPGDPCCDGGPGGAASATGGKGGNASLNVSGLTVTAGGVFGGHGGHATATGATGGAGGDCKFDDGGAGGAGGDATAVGGAGGTAANNAGGAANGGNGGDATATAGNGGPGGDSGLGVPGAGGAPGTPDATAGAGGSGTPAGLNGEETANNGQPGEDGGAMPVILYCFPFLFIVADAGGNIAPGVQNAEVFLGDDATQIGTVPIEFRLIPGATYRTSDTPVKHIGIGNAGELDLQVSNLVTESGAPGAIGGIRITPLYGNGLSETTPMIVEALDGDGQVIGTRSFGSLPDNSSSTSNPQTVDVTFDVTTTIATIRIVVPDTGFVTIIEICFIDP